MKRKHKPNKAHNRRSNRFSDGSVQNPPKSSKRRKKTRYDETMDE